LGAALCIYIALVSSASMASGRIDARTLDIWLFEGAEEFYRVGDRILRYPKGESVETLFSSLLGPDPMAAPGAEDRLPTVRETISSIDAAVPDIGLRPVRVRGLVEEAETPQAHVRLLLARPGLLDSDIRPAAGYEAVTAAAKHLGCLTFQAVPYEDRHPTRESRVWQLVGANVRIDATLPPPRFADCLFRSLLIALGLHHTQRLAFDPAPLSPAERAEALQVLALVYHPEVESGMTRRDFLTVLRRHDLLAE
jgi:hypothetical protein